MHPIPAIAPATARTALPDPRLLQARQWAAEHCAAEALARWRNGSGDPAEAGAALPAQLRWHQQTRDAYLTWLQAGGFAQDS